MIAMRKVRSVRRLAITAAAAFTAGLVPFAVPGVLAQSATPVPLPITPDPGECTVAVPDPATLLAAIASPRAGTPAAFPAVVAEDRLPAGDPADPETVAAVTATVREYLACLNAGEFLRIYALVSGDYLRTQVVPNEPTAEGLAAFRRGLATAVAASPQPLPEAARTSLVEIGNVRMLEDGRVGAVVVTEDAETGSRQDRAFVVFTNEGGRLLIDAVSQIIPGVASSPTPGTPTP
jgi:ketosteroid isomerase-like protein